MSPGTFARAGGPRNGLEGGTILRSDLETRIRVDAHAPGNLHMEGSETLTVERTVNTIVVRTESLQTFERYHIGAEITIDGRPFYRRSWDLDLSQAEWNYELSAISHQPSASG